MDKHLKIKSNIHDYEVFFGCYADALSEDLAEPAAVVVDVNVLSLYKEGLEPLLEGQIVILVEATEVNKTMDYSQKIIGELTNRGFKRNMDLIAIGGGIIQDLTCFTASILFRGIGWKFYPTTLLAQCDSCIGSKSSINVGTVKNQVGTFYPPKKIVVDIRFTQTLDDKDILSGLGEAIKVHYLDEKMRYAVIFENYKPALTDMEARQTLIYDSLVIKKRVIEIDEYDRDYRNIMNYGHTFGHALESVANYSIPHGVAVVIGIGLANHVSAWLGLLPEWVRVEMEALVLENSGGVDLRIDDLGPFWDALKKDKKNIDSNINFVLTKGFGKMFKKRLQLDENLKGEIAGYLRERGIYVGGEV